MEPPKCHHGTRMDWVCEKCKDDPMPSPFADAFSSGPDPNKTADCTDCGGMGMVSYRRSDEDPHHDTTPCEKCQSDKTAEEMVAGVFGQYPCPDRMHTCSIIVTDSPRKGEKVHIAECVQRIRPAVTEMVRGLVEDRERLEKWVDDLQSGLYINCVYCGHQYGLESVGVRREMLHDHIKVCPEHPLSKAEEKVRRLEKALRGALAGLSITEWGGPKRRGIPTCPRCGNYSPGWTREPRGHDRDCPTGILRKALAADGGRE